MPCRHGPPWATAVGTMTARPGRATCMSATAGSGCWPGTASTPTPLMFGFNTQGSQPRAWRHGPSCRCRVRKPAVAGGAVCGSGSGPGPGRARRGVHWQQCRTGPGTSGLHPGRSASGISTRWKTAACAVRGHCVRCPVGGLRRHRRSPPRLSLRNAISCPLRTCSAGDLGSATGTARGPHPGRAAPGGHVRTGTGSGTARSNGGRRAGGRQDPGPAVNPAGDPAAGTKVTPTNRFRLARPYY